MNTLVAISGVPGTGKTTVAEAIADRIDATVLRTDVVRKELYDDPEYTETETETVYDEVLERARKRLATENVVVDATFRTREVRDAARVVAEETDSVFRLVGVDCDDAVVRERIRERTDDESDADIEVYELFREQYEPLDAPDLVVDNSGSLAETFAQLDEL
ncbi:MAG: AAA family ATPase [Halobacteriales archaeon]|nr:AAA family ATPase [Halobacteriales archaeon]